jgi:ABC-type Zn uptake system ZnuABC Zn-binding protein ZnuA
MTRTRCRLAVAALLAAGVVSACGPGPSTAPSGSARLPVTTTSTVFGDMIANVGGDLVEVTSIVPRDADVHTFEPTPDALQAVSRARLIVMNGLGLDDWLAETITNAAAQDTPLVELAVDLPSAELLPGEEPGERNPHLWMAVPYAILYVDRMEALDAAVRTRIASIPAQDRKLVTFHDAFPYFASAYGLEVVGVAVEAPGQDPSAGEIAALIEAIRASGVKAIFSESQFPTELVDRIATETGATVVAELYDDSLGDPPISSYEAVIDWDVDQLVEALT